MNWKIFSILFLAIFSSVLGQGLVVPLLPVYAHELGATGLLIGFVFGSFSLSRTLSLPIFGRLSDTRGRKPIIVYGLFAYVLTSIAFMYSKDLTTLLVTRFFQGIASAMILPVAQAYVGEITPMKKEGFIMGLLNVSLYLGLSIGPLVGGVVKDAFGIQAAFLSMGLICLAGFIFCLIFLPPRKAERISARHKAPLQFRVLIRNRHLAGLLLFRFSYTLCIGSIWAFAPYIADKEFGFSSSATGVMITLSVFISAVFMTPMGLVADRVNKKFLLTLGGLLFAFAMLFVTHMQMRWELYAASIIIGIGGAISMPPLMAMTTVVGRTTDSMGSVMAISTMGHSLGLIVGPVLVGSIMDLLDIRLAFMGAAVIMFLTIFLFLFLTAGFEKTAGGS